MPQRNQRSRIDDIEPSADNFSIMNRQNRRNRSPTLSTPPPEYEEYNQAHFMQLPIELLDDDFSTISMEQLPPQPQRTKQRAVPIPSPGIAPGRTSDSDGTLQNSINTHRSESETRPRFQNENISDQFPDEDIPIQRD
jgi:hypothetical protein